MLPNMLYPLFFILYIKIVDIVDIIVINGLFTRFLMSTNASTNAFFL